MGRFIINRFISMLITLLFVITITFFLMHAIPGGPFTREKALPPAVVKVLEEKYNLDQPLWKQYVMYVGGIAKGDLGPSFQRVGVTVNQLIRKGFPVSGKMGLVAVIMVLALGVPI